MFAYKSSFSPAKPVIFIDSADYIDEDYSFYEHEVVKNLDFRIIIDVLYNSIKRSNLNAEHVLKKYCIPTQDIAEIRARQEVVREIYENRYMKGRRLEDIIYDRIESIIFSASQLHYWSNNFICNKSFKNKTNEAEHLVELVEASLAMWPKSKRLKSVKQFAKTIANTPEYQTLKKYVAKISLDFFKKCRIDSDELEEMFPGYGHDKKFTGASLVEIYQKIAKSAREYSEQVNRLDVDVRRQIYSSLRDLQNIFKGALHNPELELIIDRKEAKTLGLEEQLGFAMNQLKNTAILNFTHRSKTTKAQKYFLQGFGALLDHIDQLIADGLDGVMEKLGAKTKEMAEELSFYYSLAKLAYKMELESPITMPVLLEPEKRYCSVKGGNVPSFTLRDNEDHPLVANDVLFDKNNYVFLLTGANDNGKTTYERMVGQIQVLAQLGSFVPAEKVKLSSVDCVITSFGGIDKPEKKEGSFRSALNFLNFITTPKTIHEEYDDRDRLVQKEIIGNPSAEELALAYQQGKYVFFTPHSLLLFDEIAVGSDNLATEEAISRALTAAQQRNARLLISTHYHPVACRVQNGEFPNTLNLGAVMRIGKNGKLIETYKIKRGKHEESHGQRLFKEAGYTKEKINEATKLLIDAGIIKMDKS